MPDNLAFFARLSVRGHASKKHCRFGPLSVIAASRLPGIFRHLLLGPRGGVVTQRTANPRTPVQFRAWPPLLCRVAGPPFTVGDATRSAKRAAASLRAIRALVREHGALYTPVTNGDHPCFVLSPPPLSRLFLPWPRRPLSPPISWSTTASLSRKAWPTRRTVR